MKKILVVVGLIIAAVAVAATSIQPSLGLTWVSNTDPTVGPGVAAPGFQLLIRTDVPSLYYKSGTSNTAWTRMTEGSATVPTTNCSSGTAVTAIGTTGAGTCTTNASIVGFDFGMDGVDGALTCFDGSTVCAGLTPSSGTYTMVRDLYPTDMTLSNGAIINCQGFRIFGTGTLTGSTNAKIHNNGQDGGVTAPPNSGGVGGTRIMGRAGSNGGGAASTGASGGASTNLPASVYVTDSSSNFGTSGSPGGPGGNSTTVGRGGGGGGNNAGTGGNGGTTTTGAATLGDYDFPASLSGYGNLGNTAAPWTVGTGGGGAANGGCVPTALGGGGGGGGGEVVVAFRRIVNITIESRGGNGATGQDCSAANGNGGSGGGGGGGGRVEVWYATQSGLSTNADGGTHGNGGAKAGTGADGAIGGDGFHGVVLLHNTSGDGT